MGHMAKHDWQKMSINRTSGSSQVLEEFEQG